MLGERLTTRVFGAVRLLRSFHGYERLALAKYMIANAAEKYGHLSPQPSTLTLTLPTGLTLRCGTFASQLGPYIEVFLDRIYERVPGFGGGPGQTVLDVGANIGIYTLRLATVVGPSGRLFAIEPNPTAFKMLRTNVESNGLSWVSCVPVAMSARSERAVDFWSSERWSSTAGLWAKTGRTDHRLRVDTISLDDFVDSRGIEGIDILKMDTEGAEGLIVEGGLQRALPITQRVVMESHRTRDKVRGLLEPLGFTMVRDDRPNHVVYFERR